MRILFTARCGDTKNEENTCWAKRSFARRLKKCLTFVSKESEFALDEACVHREHFRQTEKHEKRGYDVKRWNTYSAFGALSRIDWMYRKVAWIHGSSTLFYQNPSFLQLHHLPRKRKKGVESLVPECLFSNGVSSYLLSHCQYNRSWGLLESTSWEP